MSTESLNLEKISFLDDSENNFQSIDLDHYDTQSTWSESTTLSFSNSDLESTQKRGHSSSSSNDEALQVASSNIKSKHCDHTVILGLKATKGEKFNNFSESTISRDLYSLGKFHAGPLHNKICSDQTVGDFNGDILIRGDINVKHNLNAESATFNTIVAANASIQNITANNIIESDLFIQGISNVTEKTITRGDAIDIIYAYPQEGEIIINLGVDNNAIFEPNRKIVIKDVTPEFTGPSANIKVRVPAGVRIENYGQYGQGGAQGLIVTEKGEYLLYTSGGCVTFRYSPSFFPGQLPTWIIESQFIGSPRILHGTGISYIDHASTEIRVKMLHKHN